MRRILYALTAVIAIAVIAVLAGVYWIFYRALPQTSGTIETSVSQPVTIARDRLGVPHIRAKTLDDAWFAQGYTTAEDRMFQMDGLRRLAAGELSEIVGAGALDADREPRRLRMRRLAEQAHTAMPAADKNAMEAYARGVNAWIESHRGRYGFEFVLIGYEPRPWSVVDSLLCGLQMFRTLTSDWRTKLIKQQMLEGGEPEKVDYLFPYRIGAEFTPGGDAHPGSNAWAVSGMRSATGKPLLSNDMHLEFGIPGVWHMDHIEAPGMDVAGVALPGLPGIVSGHNDRIAWGLTNLEFDVQDLYAEQIDLRSGEYMFDGKPQKARAEREVIAIRGRQPEQLTTWVTRHGPIFLTGKNGAMALRWTAAEPGAIQDVFLDVDRARNWEEFKRAFSRFGGPGQNVVYADVDGNIGYHATGKLPIRRNYFGDVPVDGSGGKFEWDGFIPFAELPEAYNPADGLVVTANQNPFPRNYSYRVSGVFAPPYRSRQIRDLLGSAGHKLRPEDNLRIQKDVYSGFNKFLADQVVAAWDARSRAKLEPQNPVLRSAIAMLRGWDGQMDQNQAEPLIITLAFQSLRKAIANRASPGNGGIYATQMSSAVVERFLRERPVGWFSDYDELLLRCLADSLDEARRAQGPAPERWKWGKNMSIAIRHPVGSRLGWLAGFFNVGPVPVSGSSTTVKQTTERLGPSERMDVAVGDWDASLLNLPIGESGNPLSRHYKDQWNAYYSGASFPMQFKDVMAETTVTFVPKH